MKYDRSFSFFSYEEIIFSSLTEELSASNGTDKIVNGPKLNLIASVM
jgi:hypothetical protein